MTAGPIDLEIGTHPALDTVGAMAMGLAAIVPGLRLGDTNAVAFGIRHGWSLMLAEPEGIGALAQASRAEHDALLGKDNADHAFAREWARRALAVWRDLQAQREARNE